MGRKDFPEVFAEKAERDCGCKEERKERCSVKTMWAEQALDGRGPVQQLGV